MGIIARDPNDPNKFIVFRSVGIGLTTDGGQTFRSAITADGGVTDVLTAGQIHTNNIQIIGNDDLFYWDGNYLIAIDAADPNKFARLSSAGLYIARGAATIERPDGYKVVINGIQQNDFTIVGSSPPFTATNVYVNGYFWETYSTSPTDCDFYTFKHDCRYLKINVAMYA